MTHDKPSPGPRARAADDSGPPRVVAPPPSPDRFAWWHSLLPLGLACILCWPVFAGRIMVPADNLLVLPPWNAHRQEFGSGVTQNEMLDPIQQYLPWRHFAVDSVRAGVIPLWNPYSYCGAPFLANLQSAVLYPLSALFLLTGAARGFGISAILHLFLGGLFMLGFLRALRLRPLPSLLGAVVFMLNGFTVSWLEYPTLALWTTMWLPLALWLLELAISRRRWSYAIGCGGVIGLDLLGGHLQISTYVLLAVTAYALVRGVSQRALLRSLGSLAVALVLGLGLALAQLLPTLELARNSLRSSPDAEQALATALPWNHLVVYLMPYFFGNPAWHNYWGDLGVLPINFLETSGYVGVLTLFLAAYGLLACPPRAPDDTTPPTSRGWRTWVARSLPSFPTSFFALVLALALLVALGTPLYYVLYHAVPGFGQFRGLARMLFLAAFALAGLSAVGANALMSGETRLPAWPAPVLGGIAVAIAASATALFGSRIFSRMDSVGYLLHQWLVFLALTGASVALLLLRLRGTLAPARFGRAALAVVACDLLIAGVGFNPAVDARLDFLPTRATDFLVANIGSGRMTSIGPVDSRWMPPNTPLAYRLRDIHGYDSLVPAPYERMLVEACQTQQFRWPQPGDPFLHEAAVNYLLTDMEIAHPDWEPIYLDEGQTRIYRSRRPRPRAYLLPAERRPPAAGRPGDVRFVEDGINRVRLSVNTSGPSRLVLSDTSYPGWRVRADGEPADALPAPPVFRAVDLPPGSHQVLWQYEPSSFRVGLFLSLTCTALLAGALGVQVGRVRRMKATGDPAA